MQETWRQAVHFLVGTAIALSVAVFPEVWTVPFYATSLLAGSIVIDAIERGIRLPIVSPLLDLLERENSEPGRGAYYFVFAALGCLLLFDSGQAGTSIFVLALLDSVTTVAGQRFGRHRIYNRKTLEGSLAGFIIATGTLFAFLPPSSAFIAAGAGAIAELVSPVDDNLVVPPVVCLALVLAG